MNIKQLIDEVVSLPVEEKSLVVDTLLRSMNQSDSQIDKSWATEASKRLSDFRTGQVEAVPGHEVFRKVWEKFEK